MYARKSHLLGYKYLMLLEFLLILAYRYLLLLWEKGEVNADTRYRLSFTTLQSVEKSNKEKVLFFKVAVALMVGILFMLNIGAELCFDAIVEKVCDMFGSKGEPDIENQDPAALVGTFKRYKWKQDRMCSPPSGPHWLSWRWCVASSVYYRKFLSN